MSDSTILRRYTSGLGEGAGRQDAESEAIACDHLGCFGWLRGTRERALMLELRQKSGKVVAAGYAWLEAAEFDPSEGILLCFVGRPVRIRGRNLNAEVRPSVRLFEGITRHRVPGIREVSQADSLEAPEEACVDEAIEW